MSSTGYMKVESLKPNFRNVSVIVKVVNIGSPRVILSRRDRREHMVADAFVGDETGSVLMTLWEDQIRRLKVGDVLEVRNGYTTLYNGSLRLNIGRDGTIEKVEKQLSEVNTRNNLSQVTHIQIPWRSAETRPFKRRKRR